MNRTLTFTLALLLTTAWSICACDSDDSALEAGDSCVEEADMDECFEMGLICQMGVCGPPAAQGEPCEEWMQVDYDMGVCQRGLVCFGDECVMAGGESQPCRGRVTSNEGLGDCDGDLSCVDNFCTAI